MKQKVFVVYNEALHRQSSFHEIIGVFGTKKAAIDAIGCMEHDFFLGIDRGDFPEFREYTYKQDDPRWESIIESPEGMYEAWRIYEKEIEGVEDFVIVTISRDDIDKDKFDINDISDDDMERLASKMGDLYLDNGFFEDRDIAIDELIEEDKDK